MRKGQPLHGESINAHQPTIGSSRDDSKPATHRTAGPLDWQSTARKTADATLVETPDATNQAVGTQTHCFKPPYSLPSLAESKSPAVERLTSGARRTRSVPAWDRYGPAPYASPGGMTSPHAFASRPASMIAVNCPQTVHAGTELYVIIILLRGETVKRIEPTSHRPSPHADQTHRPAKMDRLSPDTSGDIMGAVAISTIGGQPCLNTPHLSRT